MEIRWRVQGRLLDVWVPSFLEGQQPGSIYLYGSRCREERQDRGRGGVAWAVMRSHPSTAEKLFGAALKPLRECNL